MNRKKRKDKSILTRLLFSITSCVFLGSVIFIFVAGVGLYSGFLASAAFLGLLVPSVRAGDGAFEMIAELFLSFFEGLADVAEGVFEVLSGILSAIGSIFNF